MGIAAGSGDPHPLHARAVLRDAATNELLGVVHDLQEPQAENRVMEFSMEEFPVGRGMITDAVKLGGDAETGVCLLEFEVEDRERITFCRVPIPIAEITIKLHWEDLK